MNGDVMSDNENGPVLTPDGLPVPDPDFTAKQKAAMMAYFTGDTDVEPVLFATDPGNFRDLSAKIPGLIVTSAGGACPFQSDGTLFGFPFYFRYRHGFAELEIRAPDTNALSSEHLYRAGIGYGDEYGGVLGRSEFCDLMIQLVPALERAPYLWEFQGVKIKIEDVANPDPLREWEEDILDPEAAETRVPREPQPMDLRCTATGEPEVYRTWGATPAEAYARLHQPSQYLVSEGWSADMQAEQNRLKAIDPTPLNTDTRAFPVPEPVFEVKP